MLAEEGQRATVGTLGRQIHDPNEQLIALTGFIAEQLPVWRDHKDRPVNTGEDVLTHHLCAVLNGAARQSTTWDHLQFLPQGPTAGDARRRMDINVQPIGEDLVFAGSRYNIFQPILPIECKRLPTPGPTTKRDPREYVYSALDTGGGIQRFKIGAHGAGHQFAAMIGYVQEEDCGHWLGAVNGWVSDLSTQGISGWSETDCLTRVVDSAASRTAIHNSEHARTSGSKPIRLRHLWVVM